MSCETSLGVLGIAAKLALFLLIAGMAGSVDVATLKEQLHRKRGLLCGLVCQFILMPLVGFCCVSIAQPEKHIGITLIIVASSPGGAYSNWWCSLFNADLSMSVAMTAFSTLLAAGMLPLNLLIYVNLLYGMAVDVPWVDLLQSTAIVLAGIISGIVICTKVPHSKKWMGVLGNSCGIILIVLTGLGSVFSSKSEKEKQEAADAGVTPLWGKSLGFYLVTLAPFVGAILLSLLVSSIPALQLKHPERVTVIIETAYQNIGIASAVSLAAFCKDPRKLSDATAVPLIYGVVEAVCLACVCLIAWKCGWTYAPANSSFFKVIRQNFQPITLVRPCVDEKTQSRTDDTLRMAGMVIGEPIQKE